MAGLDPTVHLFDLVACLSKTMDVMCPAVAHHNIRVAYLAFRLGEELGLPAAEKQDLALAGALHDIGAFSLQERLDLLEFEITKPGQHAEAAYLLMKGFPPLSAIASLIRCHHVLWKNGAGAARGGQPVPRGSHILHLADRVAVLITRDKPVLAQVEGITGAIAQHKGEMFVPELVEALLRLAQKDYIWLETVSDALPLTLRRALAADGPGLTLEDLADFARLVCRLIDFRSAFTATHSSGLAASAVALARRMHFSEEDCQKMRIAAYLHDVGKLGIPVEIIDKPGPLTAEEWDIMRTHAFYTYQILEQIGALTLITAWSALHQERLDGSGYPFRYNGSQLSLGSRIMAVADVFTGITEGRPYRKGMKPDEAMATLREMGDRGELDSSLVALLSEHFDEINALRAAAQVEAAQEYREFAAAVKAAQRDD